MRHSLLFKVVEVAFDLVEVLALLFERGTELFELLLLGLLDVLILLGLYSQL